MEDVFSLVVDTRQRIDRLQGYPYEQAVGVSATHEMERKSRPLTSPVRRQGWSRNMAEGLVAMVVVDSSVLMTRGH